MKHVNTAVFTVMLMLISGCSSTQHILQYDQNSKDVLLQTENKSKKIKLNDPVYEEKSDRCVERYFNLRDYDKKRDLKLYFEYISIKHYCIFTDYYGKPYFKQKLKKLYDAKSVALLDKEVIRDFELFHYSIDGKFEIFAIAFHSQYQKGYIIDRSGQTAKDIKHLVR